MTATAPVLENTTTDAPHSSVRSTTPGAVWRQLRVPLVLGALILVTAFAITFFRLRIRAGALDPRSASPDGSRAVAQLLGERGIQVRRVTAVPDAMSGTVLVPFASDLSVAELRRLSSPSPGVHVVLVAPVGHLDLLGVPVTAGAASDGTREPECTFGPAVTAGAADVGGAVYDAGSAPGADVQACYPSRGPSLVHVGRSGAGVTVMGSAAAFTNDRLDEQGDAALALGLLDNGAPVTWVMRGPAGTVAAGERKALFDLLPDGAYAGILQLIIAALVAMAWRGRRLGPVVTEPLPVVVRAAEAVEGRGRLYAAGKARGRAAWNLRRSAQDRLRQRFSLPPDASSAALVDSAATRTPRPPSGIAELLYGPDPVDDAGLVRLATDLDHLDSEVRRS